MNNSTAESSLSPIKRTTLADQVYLDIKELILSGNITPEERLTLRNLAAAVGTSPMPVRDAVNRLVTEKALELLPNRRIRASWPSRGRFEEIIEIRCNLEALAAKFACGCRTADELDEIKRQAKEFERFASGPDSDADKAMRANRMMHFTIYRAAGMPTLCSMIEALWLQVGPVFWAIVGNEINQRNSDDVQASGVGDEILLDITFRSHAALVSAIAEQNEKAAQKAIVDDILKASKLMLRTGQFSDNESVSRKT